MAVHLMGVRNDIRGHKLGAIKSQSNCSIDLTRYNSKSKTPMEIRIESNGEKDFKSVTVAKRMLVDSLLEFLGDPNSEMRLMYALAQTCKGTFNVPRNNKAVQQENPHTNRLVWMKVVELTSTEYEPHGRYLVSDRVQQELTSGTGCTMKVYGSEGSTPELCGPYVLVKGTHPIAVNEVADRVEKRIRTHQQSCTYRCQYRFSG